MLQRLSCIYPRWETTAKSSTLAAAVLLASRRSVTTTLPESTESMPTAHPNAEKIRIQHRHVKKQGRNTGGKSSPAGGFSTEAAVINKSGSSTAAVAVTEGKEVPAKCRPMLSEKRRSVLGDMYSLVGSHSAVKLCRWQKSMMRGRGGCYKWSFYGIESHRCMEATPSMACANKCTFCWRHNTNPTAKEWKWDVDEPELVVNGMVQGHKELIQNAKGIPGVTVEKFDEAMEPRHCALSLVGEPIIYPRINEFLSLLHKKHISTFMVNNGQFPECIEKLNPVTQLYLSVDAATKDSMQKLDRPVFTDFWERFNQSIENMRGKPGRRVMRLTMIEGFNMDDEHIELYADMFRRGEPDFVELKQLTPGWSNSATFLRLENVPTWERVIEFGTKLAAATTSVFKSAAAHNSSTCSSATTPIEYGVACAHEHSKCLLLANKSRYYKPYTAEEKEVEVQKLHAEAERELIDQQAPRTVEVTSEGSVGGETDTAANTNATTGLATPPTVVEVPDGQWYTWIDFNKFHALSQQEGFDVHGPEALANKLPGALIKPEDYLLPTPHWATFGAVERGFDPEQQRHVTKKRQLYLDRERVEAITAATTAVSGAVDADASGTNTDAEKVGV